MKNFVGDLLDGLALDDDTDNPPNYGPIIGGVIGGLMALCLLTGVLVLCWKKRKINTDEQQKQTQAPPVQAAALDSQLQQVPAPGAYVVAPVAVAPVVPGTAPISVVQGVALSVPGGVLSQSQSQVAAPVPVQAQ